MIYDCFTFFNELDMLELRLNELDSVVDKFVLVEATFTFQGNTKPLYYNENKPRFEKFEKKIIHIVLGELPSTNSTWEIETYQRNAILLGLTDAQPNDLILISDVDEIPTTEGILCAAKSKVNSVFLMEMYYYYLNYLSVRKSNFTRRAKYFLLAQLKISKYILRHHELYYWYGTVALKFKNITTIQQERESRQNYSVFPNLIKNAGWHLSYFGGSQKIAQKIESFAHTELNTAKFKNEEEIIAKIKEGLSLHDPNTSLKEVDIYLKFPQQLIKNTSSYTNWILK